jgi:hypothetical protein
MNEGLNAFTNAVQNNNQKPGACHLKQKERQNMKIKTSNQSAGLNTCLGLMLAATVCTTSLPVQAALPDVTRDYTIQTIDVTPPPGGVINEIYCVFINDSGMVVMQYNSVIGNGSENQGDTAIVKNGVPTIINVPNSAWTGCGNPTACGQVPLAYADMAGNWHSALYHHGTYTYLPDCPPPFQCGVQLINDHLIMTGMAFDPTGGGWDPVWDWYCVQGVLFNPSLSLFQMFDYPGAYSTYPLGINDADQIVGTYSSRSDNGVHCFFSDRGKTFVNIDPPGSANPPDTQTRAAFMINNQGEICGYYTDASTGVQEGFLLRRGKFFAFNVPQSSSTAISCITDDGKLSGVYLDTETPPMPHAFIASPRCDRH